MQLSWNEIKHHTIAFSKEWQDETREEAEAKSFWDAFPGATLADLCDPLAIPPALAVAHAARDRAVDKCYRPADFPSDRDRVEHPFQLYEQLTAPLAPPATAKPKRPRNARN